MDIKVTTLVDLKKEVGRIVNEDTAEFPAVITYNRGFEHKTFKITIEEHEEDFFIDSKGEKWMRVKDKH